MSVCALVDLRVNEQAQVTDLPVTLRTRARLISFGLLPGSSIRVLQNSGSCSLLLESRGLRFALGRSEARQISVVRL